MTELTAEEVAFNAHASFRRLIPQFEAFARQVIGHKVTIEASKKSATDGEKIFIKPPYELGLNFQHNRNLCDKLDFNGFQRCPACGVRESLIFKVYHEISHLLYGTFEGDYAEAAAILRSYRIPKVRRVSNATRDWTIYHTAFATSPYLGAILNVVEDVRVDSKMFFTKPGLRRMMQVSLQAIMDSGIKDYDGTSFRWSDLPLDVQVTLFFYMTGRRQGFRQDVFHKEVIALESDAKLLGLLSGMERLDSVADSFARAIELWLYGKTLGFFLEEGTDDPPEQKEEQPEESDDEGLDGDPSGGGQNDDAGDDTSEGAAEDSDGQGAETPADSDLEDDTDPGEGRSSESGDDETGGTGTDDSSGDEESDQGGDEGTDADGDSEPGDSAGSDEAGSEGDPQADGPGVSGSDEPGERGDSASGETDGEGDPSADARESDDPGTPDEGETSEGDGGDPQSDVADSDGESSGTGDGIEDGPSDPNGESSDSSDDGAAATYAPPSDAPPARRDDTDTGRADDGTGPDADPVETAAETEQAEAPRPATPAELWKAYRDRNGDTDQFVDMMEQVFGHSEVASEQQQYEKSDEDRAMDRAAVQSIDFDEVSRGLAGVAKIKTDTDSWQNQFAGWLQHHEDRARARTQPYILSSAELSMPALKLRKVFGENKRNRYTKNTKRGKVNGASLGKRAPVGDNRVFQRKEVNDEKSHAVVLIGDISASTAAFDRLEQVKACVLAQADLLHRLGVPFQVLAHSGYDIADMYNKSRFSFAGHHKPLNANEDEKFGTGAAAGEVVMILTVKDWKEPWGETQRNRLLNMPSTGYNLDGHVFEYCRKQLETRPETDRLLMYYSDGQMPAQNFTEELHILQRELQLMKKLGIATAAVGIQDNGPAQHGIPMIQYTEKADIHKVVDHIAQQLGAV